MIGNDASIEVVELPPDPGVEVIEVAPDAFDPMLGAEVVAVGLGPLVPDDSAQAAARYVHTQTDAATLWIVDHNLGHLPTSWSLFDDLGRLCRDYLVETPTVNRLLVRADIPVAGTFRVI